MEEKAMTNLELQKTANEVRKGIVSGVFIIKIRDAQTEHIQYAF